MEQKTVEQSKAADVILHKMGGSFEVNFYPAVESYDQNKKKHTDCWVVLEFYHKDDKGKLMHLRYEGIGKVKEDALHDLAFKMDASVIKNMFDMAKACIKDK